ncbi:MAG TPA: DUF2550 family protein [Cellulomonas sp.]
MPGATVGVLVTLAAAVALVLVVGGLWLSRTRTLNRRVGSVVCLLAEREAGPWRAGIAQYGRVRMGWWRRASLSLRAASVWQRQGLVVLERRTLPEDRLPGERALAVVVHCRAMTRGGPVEVWLKMGPAAYAGFTGWIEATPTTVGTVI